MNTIRYPFLIELLCFTCGVFAGKTVGLLHVGFGVLLVAGLAACWFLRGRPYRMLGLFLIVGWIAGGLGFLRLESESQRLARYGKEKVPVSFRLTTAPQPGKQFKRSTEWKFSAADVRVDGKKLLRKTGVSFYVPVGETVDRFPAVGEYWAGSARVKLWKNRKVFVNCDADDIEVQADRGFFAGIQTALSERLLRGTENIPPRICSLMPAMVLGKVAEMDPGLKRIFRDTGTIHIFAVSGLHTALVAGLAVWLFRLLGVGRRWRGVCAIPLTVFYVLISGSSPSAVRAGIMAAIYFAAPLFGRQPNLFNVLMVTGFLGFGFSPEMGFEIGWLLSFSVVLGLIMGLPIALGGWEFVLRRKPGVFGGPFWKSRLRHWFSRKEATMDLRLMQAALEFADADELRRVRFRHWLSGYLPSAVGLSITAWLASLPLIVFYFGRVSLIGIVVNLVAVPLSGAIMTTGFFAILVGFVWPTVGILLNLGTAYGMELLTAVIQVAAELQGRGIEVEKVSIAGLVLLYLVVFLLFYAVHRVVSRSDSTLFSAGTESP